MKLVDASTGASSDGRVDRLALWEYSVDQVAQRQDIIYRSGDPSPHDSLELDLAIFKERLRPRPVVRECDGCPTAKPVHVQCAIAEDFGDAVRVDSWNFL